MIKCNALPELEVFLEEYRILKEDFEETGLDWNELKEIYFDYHKIYDSLETTGIHLFNDLMKIDHVHSVRYRIKEPEHLIEKIIRKKINYNKHPEEYQDVIINLKNYKEKITDLIGLRAIHLFKVDWEKIHDSIIQQWDLEGEPVANYREGDSQDLIDSFKKKNCKTKGHKAGYRSVHYIIITTPAKEKIFAELQVRTIFEEAWSEIDHTIRYPYYTNNPMFSDFLLIMNRLSGSVDEMGSFIEKIKSDVLEKEKILQKTLAEKEASINELRNRLQVKSETNKLIKTVDFVSVHWMLNHWGGKVCFREGKNLVFKGHRVKDASGTEGSHCNIPQALSLNQLYKIECKAIARGTNPTGKLSLWCHDNIEVPDVPVGISDETGYIPISTHGTLLTLYFIPRNNTNIRIHLQYKPEKDETGEIIVEEGVKIYLVE